jgi:hypothetical protein
MDPNQSIDFTRGSLGLWALWICFGLALSIAKRNFNGVGLRGIVRAILPRVMFGFAISTVIVGALTFWRGTHPQYFTRMRLFPERVILGFSWPAPDKTIGLDQISDVSITRTRSIRRGVHFRLQIATPSETFRSFGYRQLSDRELAVLDALRSRVRTGPEFQSRPADTTNSFPHL